MKSLEMVSWKAGLQAVSLIDAIRHYSIDSLVEAKAKVERLLAGESVALEFLNELKLQEFKEKAISLGVIFSSERAIDHDGSSQSADFCDE